MTPVTPQTITVMLAYRPTHIDVRLHYLELLRVERERSIVQFASVTIVVSNSFRACKKKKSNE